MQEQESDFSIKSFFVPLTNKKVIHFIILIGFITYFFSFFNGFVWDDNQQLINNESVHSIQNIPHIFLGTHDQAFGAKTWINHYYRPGFFTVLTLIYVISGAIPFIFHFLQVCLHIINSMLLYYFFLSFFRKKIAFSLSLIFLIHPISTEAVAYISALGDILFFFFGICVLLLLQSQILNYKKIVSIIFLLTAALFTKEAGILFVFITLLYTYIFRKNLLAKLSICCVSSLGIYSFMRFLIAQQPYIKLDYLPIMHASVYERFLTLPKILFFYISTFLYPQTLTIFQTWLVQRISVSEFYLPLIFDLLFFSLVFGYAYYLKKSNKKSAIYIFFIVWFVAGLSLFIHIVPLDMTVADRWFYFPMVGLLGILGVVITNIKNTKFNKLYFIIFAVIIVSILSIRTMIRMMDWKDELTLYSHDIKTTTNNFELEEFLGIAFGNAGKIQESIPHYEGSISIFPYNVNYSNAALAYEQLGKKDKAKYYYDKSVHAISLYKNIGTDPSPLIYENAGSFYLKNSYLEDAKKTAQLAVKKYPEDGKLWLILGISEYQLSEKKQALDDAKRANEVQPSDINTFYYSQMRQNQKIVIQ